MAYSYARNTFTDNNTVPNQSPDRLGVSRNTTGQIFLSGSRLETTPGYVEFNAVNEYDKANHYRRNKPIATESSISKTDRNPYGWLGSNLASPRRTADNSYRDEEESRRHADNVDIRGRSSDLNVDRRTETNERFFDFGQTRRDTRVYSDQTRTERSGQYTSRESARLRQTIQESPGNDVQANVPNAHARAELGRTQLRSTRLHESIRQEEDEEEDDDDDNNPFGWQALGPTRRPPVRTGTQQGLNDRNDKDDNINATQIRPEAKISASTKKYTENSYGDTLMPPKKQVAPQNIRQTMTYDYPYMKQVAKSTESEINVTDARSQKWILMATDHKFMRWLHMMFHKIRSKGGLADETTIQRREMKEQQPKPRRRHRNVPLYTCQQRLAIGLIVMAVIAFASLLTVFIITDYQQGSPSLGLYTIQCSLLNFTYVDALSNQSSAEFNNISQSFCSQIDANALSPSSDIGYVGCSVDQIRNVSTGVNITFSIVLRSYNFILEDEVRLSLNLIPDETNIISLGDFDLSSDINIQPLTEIDDENNPLNQLR